MTTNETELLNNMIQKTDSILIIFFILMMMACILGGILKQILQEITTKKIGYTKQ